MNKKIIFVPWFPRHRARETLLSNPPKHIKYIIGEGDIKNKNIEPIVKHNGFLNKIKNFPHKIINKILSQFQLPNIEFKIPKNKFYFDYYLKNYSVILSNKKFIVYQLENILNLFNTKGQKLNSRLSLILLKTILLSSRCKYIFCMSEAAKESAIKILNIPEKKQEKFQVIYPTIKPIKYEKDNNNHIVRLLYLSKKHIFGDNFYWKGGKLVLQAFEKLKKKYNNIELVYDGYVPPNFKRHFKKISGIKFYEDVPYERIIDFYKKADIFLYPTYGDNFGFALIEAMGYGLPIICINNHFASSELVLNNETGFLVDTSLKFLKYPYRIISYNWIQKWKILIKKEDDLVGLNNFVEKLEILIQNKELREKFGNNGRNRLINGEISIKARNRKLNLLFKN
ncbi:MAG: glycosyltransferase family 4 protein [Promethearchaeota archaeon]